MSTCVLLAAFETPERATAAVARLHHAGHHVREAYGPLPSEKMSHAVGLHRSSIRSIMFIAGVIGVITGLAMQYWSAVIDYPINSGGRPLASWPAFVPVAFEIGILFAALAGFVAFLVEARLTRIHAPIFTFDGFERASHDRFFLQVETNRAAEACTLLEQLGATAILEGPE